MAKFKLFISSSAEKKLKKVPKKDSAKIVLMIQSLTINPYPVGCRKLSGEENIYRVRQGQYRIVYEVKNHELIVLILKLGHRKDIYRK